METAKRKLTKEELLAGKCEPQDDNSGDPRLKSPDEILLQRMASRGAKKPVTIERGYEEAPLEHNHEPEEAQEQSPAPRQIAPTPQPAPAPAVQPALLAEHTHLKTQYKHLHDNYEKDKVRWKEYEQKVVQWKDQVMEVIRNLQNDSGDVESLKKEVETLKELNRQKEQEIQSLAEEINNSAKKKK